MKNKQSGFTLIEVMVALIIVAVGLLGVARIEALSLSETATASKRSLAALEAASLAASMHSNRVYWSSGLEPSVFSIVGTTVTDSTGVLNQSATCNNVSCTAQQLAAFDVQQWAAALNAILPQPTTVVTCSNIAGVPVNCTIQISWAENLVSVSNAQAAGSSAPSSSPTNLTSPMFTLYVEP